MAPLRMRVQLNTITKITLYKAANLIVDVIVRDSLKKNVSACYDQKNLSMKMS